VGGRSASEKALGEAIIAAARAPLDNLIGATDLKTLLAVFERARVLLTPDSGPAHMANAVNLTTIALHAATDPRRSAPYCWRTLCVDYYPVADARYRHATPDRLAWGTRIEDDGVMALIPVAAVTAKLDAAMRLAALQKQSANQRKYKINSGSLF
jgi:heptosyltransferase I